MSFPSPQLFRYRITRADWVDRYGAVGATLEALFILRLLPPREVAKLFGTNGMVGRGGGDRTNLPSAFSTIH